MPRATDMARSLPIRYAPPMSVPLATSRRLLDATDLQRLKQGAEHVFGARSDVTAVYLYGSAARGESARDLDVAVLFRSEPPPPRELEELAAELQRAGAPHGPEIDLRCLNGTAPRFRANVLRDARVLVDRDRAVRIAAEARALSEWLDFKPVWERMRARMLERLGDG